MALPLFECWQKTDHAEMFNARLFYPTFCLDRVYENFNEFRLMKQHLAGQGAFSLLDIGCATGEISRYLRSFYPQMDYTGCDISKAAVETARKKYPGAKYLITGPQLDEVRNLKPDYVFSRDVILHQTDPFGFLKNVCSIAQKGVFLRLRTRDRGKTVLDTDHSCQLNYGLWAPYIVMNCDEIAGFLSGLKMCPRAHFLKHHMILGGLHSRFLPKDCYLEETGTAETAMFIEIKPGAGKTSVTTEQRKEGYEIPLYGKLIKRSIQYTVGPRSQRVWW